MDFKDILKKQLQKKGIGNSIKSALVCDFFEEWVLKNMDKDILNYLEVVSFKSGVLKIRVLSPVVSQELVLHKEEILDYILDKTGEKDLIAKIVFV